MIPLTEPNETVYHLTDLDGKVTEEGTSELLVKPRAIVVGDGQDQLGLGSLILVF